MPCYGRMKHQNKKNIYVFLTIFLILAFFLYVAAEPDAPQEQAKCQNKEYVKEPSSNPDELAEEDDIISSALKKKQDDAKSSSGDTQDEESNKPSDEDHEIVQKCDEFKVKDLENLAKQLAKDQHKGLKLEKEVFKNKMMTIAWTKKRKTEREPETEEQKLQFKKYENIFNILKRIGKFKEIYFFDPKNGSIIWTNDGVTPAVKLANQMKSISSFSAQNIKKLKIAHLSMEPSQDLEFDNSLLFVGGTKKSRFYLYCHKASPNLGICGLTKRKNFSKSVLHLHRAARILPKNETN